MTFTGCHVIITLILDFTGMIDWSRIMEPHVLSEQELKIHNDLYDKADAKVEKEIAETLAANAENSSTAKKRKMKIQEFSLKGMMVNLAVLCLILTAVIYGLSKYMTLYPYAVMAGDDVICYVDSKMSATEAVQKAVDEFKEGDSNVVSVNVGDSLNVERMDTRNVDKVVSADEAAKLIIEKAQSDNGGNGITVVSTGTETRTFTPEPTYERDETALAGTTVVKEEGQDGTEEVAVTYVTVDGELENKEDVSSEVVQEGKSAVIVKGTLGVPTDESWETYEGSPVFNSGDDLVVTAKQYVGKVPYVKGGTSLSSGVDCVGFVRAIYKLYGVNLSSHLGREGYRVPIKDAQPGDIMIFAHHVAIYAGNGKMVHALNPKWDVCVTSTNAGTDLQEVRRIPRQ